MKQVVTLNYPPIAEQPEYKAEDEKLRRFTAQRAEAQHTLDALQAEQAAQTTNAGQRSGAESDISAAESLLSGTRATSSLAEQIKEATRKIEVLAKAMTAQRGVVDAVIRKLSHVASERLSERHKLVVARMVEAAKQLHEADLEEVHLHDVLLRLGYSNATIPVMTCAFVFDPYDSNNTLALGWLRDAENYSRTIDQLETNTRRDRLAAFAG